MTPKVSITMPVLNGERYIGRALESILAQTYRDFELTVVDDGSTDGTARCVEAFRGKLPLRYVKHDSTQGIARSVNDGLRHSTGEFIAFLDHDDRWLPEFLQTQTAYLESHPDVAMAHSDFQIIDGDGNIVCPSVARWRGRTRPSGRVFPQLFMYSFIVGNSVLIRKACLDRVGGFNEELRFGDYHLWMRIARNYKIDYVDMPLTQYRHHRSQSTRNVPVARPGEDSVAIQSIRKILEEFPQVREELGNSVIDRRIASLYFDLAYAWFVAEAPANARICLTKAIQLWPSNSRYHALYAASLLPRGLRAGMQNVRRWWRRRNSPERTSAQAAGGSAITEIWQG